MHRRQPWEHVTALAALVLSFLVVTVGIGTVAAAASTPKAVPHAVPSQGAQAVIPAGARRSAPLVSLGFNVPVRPGTSAHVSPPPPVWFSVPPGPPPPSMHFTVGVASGILVDLDTHAILWQGQPNEQRPTASLAKIFTVMVAMDHATSFYQHIVVPPGGEDDDITHSVMGLKVGDVLSVQQLVAGIWLASGDDAAETLARAFVPRDQFIAEMNAKAAWLGLQNTHFTNPSGLDDPGEYSSAYDLAVAAGYLWTHYPDAFGLASWRYFPLVLRGQDLSLKALNKLTFDYNDTGRPYPGVNGLKTGDTPNAGGCVVVTAQRGQKRLIAVVMDSDWFFTNAAVLLNYGFAVDH